MNRTWLASVTFFLFIATRVADLAVTLHFNPSLDREANPIVRIFGGGAASLATASFILILFLSAGLFLFWRGGGLRRTEDQSEAFPKFVVTWLRDVARGRDRFREWMPGGARWPHSVQALRLTSVALSWAMILGSVGAIGAWIGLQGGVAGFDLFTRLPLGSVPGVPWLLACLGVFLGSGLFFLTEWRATGRVGKGFTQGERLGSRRDEV